MLIRNAELFLEGHKDVRLNGPRIEAIGDLAPRPEESVLDGGGNLLLPGLHDHHIHMPAVAASLASIDCGPPNVSGPEDLANLLNSAGDGWIRGTGYHESVAGMLDAQALDALAPGNPVRIQHRTGRMWFLNSRALDILLEGTPPPPGLERAGGKYTGRLFDEDAWLRAALGGLPPGLINVGQMLCRHGVTGVTDLTPQNDATMAAHFARENAEGRLPQRILMAGRLDLVPNDIPQGIEFGPAKLHLHEADLPPYKDTVDFIRTAHETDRAVAVHCVTEVELVYTLAAFAEAKTIKGDRIEHASVTPDSALAEIAGLGLQVVSQPHFIRERGDRYLADVELAARPYLYRLRSFADAGVTLAAGSDAPFGGTNPWVSMAAAVSRQTVGGQTILENEALSPEDALALYLRAPKDLESQRRVEPGAPADLCLLDRSWASASKELDRVEVLRTWIDGRTVFNGVDQAP